MRIWELRVHGVSNTPPRDVLLTRGDATDGPPPVLVAGDTTTGFYRHPDPAPDARPVTAPESDPLTTDFVVEAFSWGQLTSGARVVGTRTVTDLRRAAWSLLLPFALLNVAHWARPELAPTPGDSGRPLRLARIVRLTALSLTVTLIATAAGLGMDLIAWQCRGDCAATVRGLGWIAPLLDRQGWLLPVGALLPVGVTAGIWWVAGRTFQYEAVVPATPGATLGNTAAEHPMEHPAFWRGDRLVRDLRWAHLAVALATVAHLLAACVWADPTRRATNLPDAGWPLSAVATGAAVVSGLSLLVVVLCGSLVCRHDELAARGQASVLSRVGLTGARVTAVAGLGLVAAMLVAGIAARPPTGPARGSMPGYEASVRAIFLAQFALLLACLLVNLRSTRDQRDEPDAPAWKGLSCSLFVGTALVAELLFSIAALRGGQWWLNLGPGAAVRPSATIDWAAAGLTIGVLLGLGCALPALPLWRRIRARQWHAVLEELDREHDGTTPGAREHQLAAARVAVTWRTAHVFDGYHAFTLIGRFAVAGLAVLCLGAVVAVLAVAAALRGDAAPGLQRWVSPHRLPVFDQLSDAGGWIAAGISFALVTLVGAAYRRDTVRRVIGIVWDITTFWPRAAHPFGPPCYAERAVPQLVTRIWGLRDQPLVLAGHSQGVLLCTAALLQLPAERRENIEFLSYGTQFTRIYGRAFPAFFGPAARSVIAERLTGPGGTRWTSLWRPTDPLGWPVGGGLDVPVRDPEGYLPAPPGEVLDPPVRQHSDYPLSAEYVRERARLAARLTARLAPPRRP